MNEVFFTSDTHFGHRNIIKHAYRPFADVEAMDAELIARWNDKVGKSDTIYHLGDVSFHGSLKTLAILRRLNGRKFLVRGNHDSRMNADAASTFERVYDFGKEIKVGEQKIVLCHFPLLTWNKAHYGSWHLHGHCHGSLTAPQTQRLDVGVDAVWMYGLKGYAPLSFEEIRAIMQFRPGYVPVDRHGEVADGEAA